MRAIIGIALAITAVELCGCSSVPVDSGCKSFAPIRWSTKDTEPTKRAVIAHNRVYDALCPNS